MQIEANESCAIGHWMGGFDEGGLQNWAEQLRAALQTPQVTLGLVFMSPRFFAHSGQVLEILQVHAKIGLLAGCSSAGLIAGGEEIEDNAGLVAGLYHMPGAELKAVRFTQSQVEEANGPGYWHLESGVTPEQTNGWLAFADPFNLDCEVWLAGWDQAFHPAPVLGGLASGGPAEQRTQVYLNGRVYEEGGVAISFGGAVKLVGVVSQGCTPIGETWTITKAEGNLIHHIGNRPAFQVLVETFNALPQDQQRHAQGNLFVGLVVNEYQEDFHRGDFLIRNLLGGDPASGVLAVGARPRTGQSVQFQCRDAAAASEDLVALLEQAKRRLGGTRIYGGCLCSCSGRGRHLFGVRNHDAALARRHFGSLGLTGFFCNGEIGPVGRRSYLHGYTASLVLFVAN